MMEFHGAVAALEYAEALRAQAITFAKDGERFLVTVESVRRSPKAGVWETVHKLAVKRLHVPSALLASDEWHQVPFPHARSVFEWAVNALERAGVL